MGGDALSQASDPSQPNNNSPRFATSPKFPTVQSWHSDWIEDRRPNLEAIKTDVLSAEDFEKAVLIASRAVEVVEHFCHACRHLLSHWPDIPETTEQEDVQELPGEWSQCSAHIVAASRAGCRCCGTLYTMLIEGDDLTILQKIENRLTYLGEQHKSGLCITRYHGYHDYGIHLSTPSALHGKHPSPKSWKIRVEMIGIQVPPNRELNPSRDWRLTAKNWLHSCDTEHDRCRRKHEQERPGRLVQTFEPIKIVAAEEAAQGPYATLSYCWGSSRFLRLTVTNLRQFLHRLPVDELPRLYRDAIAICQSLKVPYIWIDALCIIQDSEDDWANESALMKYIYAGGYVNIAALTATSVNESLFGGRSDRSAGFVARVTTKLQSCILRVAPWGEAHSAIVRSHLTSRAWTLQERLLAPRNLSYGDRGFFWNCQHTVASRCLPSGIGTGNSNLIAGREVWSWESLIKEYSRAKLTFPSDKLAALAGIARKHSEQAGGRYLAGMWLHQLVDQLSWRGLDWGKRGLWRAPSWSWMSVDTEVHFPQRAEDIGLASPWKQDLITVIDCYTIPAGPDPFGSIRTAHLRIACSTLVRVKIAYELLADRNTVWLLCGQGELEAFLDVLEDGLAEHEEVFLLPLVERGQKHHKNNDMIVERWHHTFSVESLVLQAYGPVRGCFRRVGVSWRPDLRILTPVIGGEGRLTAREMCIEETEDFGDARYVIDLV